MIQFGDFLNKKHFIMPVINLTYLVLRPGADYKIRTTACQFYIKEIRLSAA